MQEQSVDISFVIQQSQKGVCFTIIPIVQELLTLEMHGSLKMVKLVEVKLHKMWRLRKLGIQVPLTSTSTSSIVFPNVVKPLNDEEEQ